jgi:hypothetical protein
MATGTALVVAAFSAASRKAAEMTVVIDVANKRTEL